MSTGLERRLAKVEAKHQAERNLDRRIPATVLAELEAMLAHASQAQAERANKQ